MHLIRNLAALVVAAAASVALADSYPNKPIKLIVPYAAGGGTDISARIIARHVSIDLGQPLVIENRPGAGTLVGTTVVAKAAPDGYTLVYGSVTHTIAPALYRERMPFDAVKEFTPVIQVATFPFVLVARTSLQVSSVKELIAKAKADPGKLNYASVGNGTGTHLSGEMFKLLTGTDIVHVPYNGSGPALTSLLGGQVDLGIVDTPPAIPYIKNAQMRPLAVTTTKRAASLPDVPTLAEAGVAGFDFTSWWGVFGPANLPADITARLNRAFAKALQQPEVKASLESFSADPVGNSPEEFAAVVKSDIAKFEKVVRAAGIKIE